jgi:hypothetical protein
VSQPCSRTPRRLPRRLPLWPPVEGPGHLFVHYGEEHWNDDDGLTLLPKVVAESIRYRPALVTMSGDKANDGVVDELTRWREIMDAYDRARSRTSPAWATTTARRPAHRRSVRGPRPH